MQFKLNALWYIALCLAFTSCGKDPVADNNAGSGGGSGVPVVGSVAVFSTVPIPTVDLGRQIIPNMDAFYVTNRGPYVQIQNSTQQRRHVYKYHGGSGTTAWSSFTPNFWTANFMPTSFTAEREREFSIYWSHTDLSNDKYGMYNLNNGTTSFEYTVPMLPSGPGAFSHVFPSKKGMQRLWGIFANEVWAETAIAVPSKFEKIADIPSTGDQYLRKFFADPDEETVLWCATQNKLYKVGSVSPNAGGSPGILSTWSFTASNATETINAIIKVGSSIIVQFGNRVYKLEGNSFTPIGTLNIPSGAVANICTNGTTIFASDGNFYNSSTNKWQPFIGNGLNLTGISATRYNELKLHCTAGYPIGCNYGPGGYVYFLTMTDLIQIIPIVL